MVKSLSPHKILIVRTFVVFSLLAFAFYSFGQKKNQIEIVGGDILDFVEKDGRKANKIVGNVIFKHQNTLMYSDSAFLFSKTNSLEAYGNVRINQADTSNLYGDQLFYNGNTKVARVIGKAVRLVNDDFTLTTTEMIMNRETDESRYVVGGKIESKTDSNVLVSQKGYYHAASKTFTFKDDVVLTNPDFIMKSDTLKYNSGSKLVTFLGPTTIENDSNFIYCENGWYDTEKDLSKYYENSYLISDGRQLEGDTLFYDRKIGFGKAINHVQITDTAENIVINGDIAFFYEHKDSAIVYGKPVLTQVFDEDSLFMRADTFKVFGSSENQRTLFAYYNVKIFKSDLQGKCDSIAYSMTDSTIKMYKDPVLWSEQNQLTADFIEIRTANSKIHSIFMDANAFIISEVDSIRFNQIKGKEMTGYFKNSVLNKIEVRGNGQTTYFGQDEEDKYIGVNVAESSDIDIMLKDQAIHSITFIKKPVATMHPIGSLNPKTDLRYEGFKWLIDIRPDRDEVVR
ncbi:MAG: organic solvent tolerance protein OstA [Flavobacteriales bacterium]|nr:organic solvent tolerance protein OstA [Flavobacteriales bacterium]|tara:strand:- start:53488 stop:55023 length:1536 start_codon:yes stop_codon:yes gene_type:complete